MIRPRRIEFLITAVLLCGWALWSCGARGRILPAGITCCRIASIISLIAVLTMYLTENVVGSSARCFILGGICQ